MLLQRFWRSFFIGLFAVLLVVQSVFIRAKAETSSLGYWVVTAEAAGLNDQSQTMYNYVLHIYTMHDDARGNVSGSYNTMGGNSQTFTSITFYGRETIVNLYSGATNTIGNTIRGNGTFNYNYTGDEQTVEFSQEQWDEITQHFDNMALAMSEIDNTIDTISWIESGDNITNYYSDITTLTPITEANQLVGKSVYVEIPFNPVYRSNIVKFQSNIYTAGFINDYKNFKVCVKSNSSGNVTELTNSIVYYIANRGILTFYVFNPEMFNNTRVFLYYECPYNMYYYPTGASVNTKVYYLGQNDIEYWHILYYLQALNEQKTVINNQQTIINQQNQINQYNQQPYDTDTNDEQTNDIEGFMVDYDNKLGFIGQSFDFITSLFGVITNADVSSTIPFPGVTVPIGENGSNVTLIQAQNVDIVPNGLTNIFEYVRLANSMIVVSAVFNMAINKYKEWSMK